MLFRKALIRIRKEYNTNTKRLFIVSTAALLITALIGAIADAFLPFNGMWNALRSIILVPTAASMFILGYAVSLRGHYHSVRNNPDWTPYRMRMSPSWRRRVGAIVAAIAFVAVYANGYRIGYTFVSALFVAIVIGIFAFIRTTREEARREEFDIPDTRDTQYEVQRRKIAAARAEAQARRQREKKAHKGSSKKKQNAEES